MYPLTKSDGSKATVALTDWPGCQRTVLPCGCNLHIDGRGIDWCPMHQRAGGMRDWLINFVRLVDERHHRAGFDAMSTTTLAETARAILQAMERKL
jgi:hypothetical protein